MRTSRPYFFMIVLTLSLTACSSRDEPSAKVSVSPSAPSPSTLPQSSKKSDGSPTSPTSAKGDEQPHDLPFEWISNASGDLEHIPHAPPVANDGRTQPLCKDETRKPDGASDEALARAGWLLIDGAQTFGATRAVKVAEGLDGQCRPMLIGVFVFRDNQFVGSVLPTPRTRIGNLRLGDESFLSLTYEQYKPVDPACCPSLHGSQDFKITPTSPVHPDTPPRVKNSPETPLVQASQTANAQLANTSVTPTAPAPTGAVAPVNMVSTNIEVMPCSNANGTNRCDESAALSSCPPLPLDYTKRGEDETTTQDQRSRVADHFLCETSTDFVLSESLQKRGFTLTISDPTGSLSRLRKAKNAHDYSAVFGHSIPYFEMIPVTINGLRSSGVTVTVSHNGKPHYDFEIPEGGVIHFRQSANAPFPGHTLSRKGGFDSMQALTATAGKPSPNMVLGTKGPGPSLWRDSAGVSGIFAIEPCIQENQTSFGAWPRLSPGKDGKGWQAKIGLSGPCPIRIAPINSPEMPISVGAGVEARPVLQCTYGVDAAGKCIEFSGYFRAGFGVAYPFTEISRARTNYRQQADFGNISSEEAASKLAQMRNDFNEKASRALDELDQHFVDIIATTQVEQVDLCDQDQEKFNVSDSVSAAQCKPLRGRASEINDPLIAASTKTNSPPPVNKGCPAPPMDVESALDSPQSSQLDRKAYLVSQLCKQFAPDVALSPLLIQRGYTLRVVDKSGALDAASKAVATGDISGIFPQLPLPTYRQINFRLQELTYQLHPRYFVLHNGGKHDVIAAKNSSVTEPRVGGVSLATLSIKALCPQNADPRSIELGIFGGQPLEDGSGWELFASKSSSCHQVVLALPPERLNLGQRRQYCSYGSDTPGAPCRHPGQFFNVVTHAHPDADSSTIASYFDTAFTHFEEEFVNAYGTPVHD